MFKIGHSGAFDHEEIRALIAATYETSTIVIGVTYLSSFYYVVPAVSDFRGGILLSVASRHLFSPFRDAVRRETAVAGGTRLATSNASSFIKAYHKEHPASRRRVLLSWLVRFSSVTIKRRHDKRVNGTFDFVCCARPGGTVFKAFSRAQ